MVKLRKSSSRREAACKRVSTNGAKAPAKTIDTGRRYTKKELEQMPLEDLALLAYRMTYDRVHGKRKVRD
jgi:predicted ATPase